MCSPKTLVAGLIVLFTSHLYATEFSYEEIHDEPTHNGEVDETGNCVKLSPLADGVKEFQPRHRGIMPSFVATALSAQIYNDLKKKLTTRYTESQKLCVPPYDNGMAKPIRVNLQKISCIGKEDIPTLSFSSQLSGWVKLEFDNLKQANFSTDYFSLLKNIEKAGCRSGSYFLTKKENSYKLFTIQDGLIRKCDSTDALYV